MMSRERSNHRKSKIYEIQVRVSDVIAVGKMEQIKEVRSGTQEHRYRFA